MLNLKRATASNDSDSRIFAARVQRINERIVQSECGGQACVDGGSFHARIIPEKIFFQKLPTNSPKSATIALT